MKKNKRRIVYGLLILSVAFTSINCSSLSATRGDLNDLQELHQIATTTNSAYWASFVGETNKAIYIEYGTMIHFTGFFTNAAKETIYRFKKSEVTPEMRKLFWWDGN